MKRFLMLAVCCLAIIPVAWAQEGDHVEVGAFADYFRSNQTGTNMVGVGGRAGFGLLPYTLFEAEMSYDFNQVFSEGFTNTNGGSLTFMNTGVRTLNGLFGPKVEFGHGAVRPFVEVKGGFVNFQFDARPASFDTFTSQVSDLRAHNWNGAVMPGGGIEAKLGPVGLRLDVGDEMYFRDGTHHNLKVMIGPVFRF
ncbi:MAG: hypothetical protein WBQ89_00885 [Candidatus Acidiferrum sp.]